MGLGTEAGFKQGTVREHTYHQTLRPLFLRIRTLTFSNVLITLKLECKLSAYIYFNRLTLNLQTDIVKVFLAIILRQYYLPISQIDNFEYIRNQNFSLINSRMFTKFYFQ